MCDARRGQGELPFEWDFGTPLILAAVDRECISPVRDWEEAACRNRAVPMRAGRRQHPACRQNLAAAATARPF